MLLPPKKEENEDKKGKEGVRLVCPELELFIQCNNFACFEKLKLVRAFVDANGRVQIRTKAPEEV